MSYLSVAHLEKSFGSTRVLRDVSFDLPEGETLSVIGSSGSGKTTLLRCLNFLERPDAGVISLRDQTLLDGSRPPVRERELREKRLHFGLVFQDFNLLDTFSLRDNIFLPLVLSHKGHAEMAARLAPIARQLGIEALLDKYPYEVSGGQKQRAAVARALITKPEIVLADEPTGALDSKATTKLLRMFGEINRGGQTILMVTHSTRAASHAGRVLFIKDGVVFHQLYRGNMTSDEMFAKIGDTLTMLTTGGADRG